jgi:hypothetical protein
MVVALLQAIKKSLTKHQAQAVINVFLQLHNMEAAPGILHFQGELLFPAKDLKINQITRSDAIDAQQTITTLKAQLLPDGTRLHGEHLGGKGKPGGLFPRGVLERDASRRLNPHARSAGGKDASV